jgi:hypothetical protein
MLGRSDEATLFGSFFGFADQNSFSSLTHRSNTAIVVSTTLHVLLDAIPARNGFATPAARLLARTL